MSFKRRDLSVGEKMAILDAFDLLPQMSQREAAIRLGLSQPLLCRLLRNRYDIECSSADVSQHRKRRRSGKDGEVEAALKQWYWEQMQLGGSTHLTGDILKRKAEEIASQMGKSGFVATNGWFQRWRKRENISTGRQEPEDRPAVFELKGGLPQRDNPSDQQQQPQHHEQKRLQLVQPVQQEQQQAQSFVNLSPLDMAAEPECENPESDIPRSSSNTSTYATSASGAPSTNPNSPIKRESIESDSCEHQQSTDRQPSKLASAVSFPPTDEMVGALEVLRRGILHYDSANIQIHSTYEAYGQKLIERQSAK